MAAPSAYYKQKYDDYQAGLIGSDQIRSSGMDNDRPGYGDSSFEDEVSTDDPNYRNPAFQYYVNKGIVGADQHEQFQKYWNQTNGNIYYEPGKRLRFDDEGEQVGPLPPSPYPQPEYPRDGGQQETGRQIGDIMKMLFGDFNPTNRKASTPAPVATTNGFAAGEWEGITGGPEQDGGVAADPWRTLNTQYGPSTGITGGPKRRTLPDTNMPYAGGASTGRIGAMPGDPGYGGFAGVGEVEEAQRRYQKEQAGRNPGMGAGGPAPIDMPGGGGPSTGRIRQNPDGSFSPVRDREQFPRPDYPEDLPPGFVGVPGEDLGVGIDDTLLDLMEGGGDELNLGGRWREIMDDLRGPDQIGAALSRLLGETAGPGGAESGLLELGNDTSDPLSAQIQELLSRTRGGGVNSQRLNTRLEAARENLTRGQQTAMDQTKSLLASQGLVSMPGAPQGSEADAILRAMEPLNRDYLSELRQSELTESERADAAEMEALGFASDRDLGLKSGRREALRGAGDIGESRGRRRLDAASMVSGRDTERGQRLLNSLSQATGWDQGKLQTRLAAAQTGQERERIMGEMALGSLDRNIEWNKFLANFGLDREKAQAAIQQGKIDSIMPILQMFLALSKQSAQGYIGR